MYTFQLETPKEKLLLITAQVQQAVEKSRVRSGLCVVWCPHTTAAITVNENADPDVVHDLIGALAKTFPHRPEFRHSEGNSAAHLKSSVVGCSQTFIVEEGQLQLGTWQGIYFCEFDGPRSRRFHVQVLGH